MEQFLVLVDDAGHFFSQPQAQALIHGQPTQCVLLACAPRMTHRVSKWVSHSSREHWRDKWAAKLFDQLLPALGARGHQLRTELARGPLQTHIDALLAQGPYTVIDLRRPKREHNAPPSWPTVAVAGFGTWLALLAE